VESVFKCNDKVSAPINSGTRQGIYFLEDSIKMDLQEVGWGCMDWIARGSGL
jgi:hypothetical protein